MKAREVFGNRILCPVDVGFRSERAAELAGWFAALVGVDLRLLSVVPGRAEAPVRLGYLESLAVSMTQRFGVATTCHVSLSERMREEVRDDLDETTGVVMATSATRLPHGGHFGSVADHVVRTATKPVTLIGPKAASEFQPGPTSIVVPVDGSDTAEKAVPVAGALAELLQLPISVITILPAGRGRDSTHAETAYVHELADGLAAGGLEVSHKVIHDSNPTEHVITAVDGGLAIPVMASHGRTGLSRLVAGSVTTSVVRFASWPVMVVPPGSEVAET